MLHLLVKDYDEQFFANDGLTQLQKELNNNKDQFQKLSKCRS